MPDNSLKAFFSLASLQATLTIGRSGPKSFVYRPDPFHRDTSLDFYGYNDPPIRNFVSYLPSNDTSTQVVSTHSDILSLTPDKALQLHMKNIRISGLILFLKDTVAKTIFFIIITR